MKRTLSLFFIGILFIAGLCITPVQASGIKTGHPDHIQTNIDHEGTTDFSCCESHDHDMAFSAQLKPENEKISIVQGPTVLHQENERVTKNTKGTTPLFFKIHPPPLIGIVIMRE